MTNRRGVGVVVVVPPFAERECGNPPVIARIVARGKPPSPPKVRGGIHQPRGMQPQSHAQADSPKDQRPAANGEQDRPQNHQRHPMPAVQLPIKPVLRQIRSVLPQQLSVRLDTLAHADPAHVGPEKTLFRRMWISGQVRLLVVDTVCRHPKDRPALQRQSPEHGKRVLQPQRALVTPVRVEPVVAHADAKPDGEPVEKQRDAQVLPAKPEQCGHGSNMEQNKNNDSGPVEAFRERIVEDCRRGVDMRGVRRRGTGGHEPVAYQKNGYWVMSTEKWWARQDSNLQPSASKADALSNCATRPYSQCRLS